MLPLKNHAGTRRRYNNYSPRLHGPAEKKCGIACIAIVRSYFLGPIPWMIEIAAIISADIMHLDDLAIIILMFMTNVVVGFFQERISDNSIELLKSS